MLDLLYNRRINVRLKNKDQMTALHLIIKFNLLEVLNWIISKNWYNYTNIILNIDIFYFYYQSF